jgi:malonyl-ACP O-methyltransferase BioC
MASEIESRIIESFSKHVKTYDRHAQLQKSMAERLASLLPAPLPPKVLELGCGTGIFTRHLLARGTKELILNDIAPAMMDYLRAQMSVPASTTFIPGNAEQVSFPKVHLIAANAVFQWFQHPEPTLQRLADRLLKNGTLVFSTFGPKTLQEFREIAQIHGPTPLMDPGNILSRYAQFTA